MGLLREPSRREENETVIVDLDDRSGSEKVVQGFVGFVILDVGGTRVVKNGLKGRYGFTAGEFLLDAHNDRLTSDGEKWVVRVGVG